MDPARMIALRLAQSGFGPPDKILQMPADLVLDAYRLTKFQAEYEETMNEMNKEAR
jgi:hypothetical protein